MWSLKESKDGILAEETVREGMWTAQEQHEQEKIPLRNDMESRPRTAPHRLHSVDCRCFCWRQGWRWPAQHPVAWSTGHRGTMGVGPGLLALPGWWSRACCLFSWCLCWCQALLLPSGVPLLLPGSARGWGTLAACNFQQSQGLCSEPSLTLTSV